MTWLNPKISSGRFKKPLVIFLQINRFEFYLIAFKAELPFTDAFSGPNLTKLLGAYLGA
jgi:hypothetical protein